MLGVGRAASAVLVLVLAAGGGRAATATGRSARQLLALLPADLLLLLPARMRHALCDRLLFLLADRLFLVRLLTRPSVMIINTIPRLPHKYEIISSSHQPATAMIFSD